MVFCAKHGLNVFSENALQKWMIQLFVMKFLIRARSAKLKSQPEDAIKLLTTIPNVSNDSHSKTDKIMKDLCELKSLYSTINAKFLKVFPESTMASLKTNQRRVDKPLIPAPVTSTPDQVNPSSDLDPVISTRVV